MFSLDTSFFQVAGTLLVASLAAWMGWRDFRNRTTDGRDAWPLFWIMTTAVLVTMAIAQVSDLNDYVANVARSELRKDGWYQRRREFQAAAVGAVGVGWFAATAVTIARFPERRRRYLPTALVILALVCFAAIRSLSLHHVDALLYRSEIVGLPIGRLLELAVLAAAVATIAAGARHVTATNAS